MRLADEGLYTGCERGRREGEKWLSDARASPRFSRHVEMRARLDDDDDGDDDGDEDDDDDDDTFNSHHRFPSTRPLRLPCLIGTRYRPAYSQK